MECASSTSLSDWEEEIETVVALIVFQEDVNESSRTWVHTVNKNREKLGEFHHLVPELRQCSNCFHMYFRMSKEEFHYLHEFIHFYDAHEFYTNFTGNSVIEENVNGYNENLDFGIKTFNND